MPIKKVNQVLCAIVHVKFKNIQEHSFIKIQLLWHTVLSSIYTKAVIGYPVTRKRSEFLLKPVTN